MRVDLQKATRIELLIALYCKSSCELPSSAYAHDLCFCLPAAVKLAGGGKEATLRDRRIGLRVCDEVFTNQPHPLKLLLINTIRSDLYVPSHSPQAEARWVMGLRAASSPRLLTEDLVPAISDRVVELFASRSAPIRRMALAALLSLSSSEQGSTRDRTRSLVRDSLAPPPHLALKKQPQRPPRGPEPDPRMMCALVEAVGRGSPIYPVAEGEAVVAIYLSVLRRPVAGEWREFKWEYHGVACGWLASKVLDGLKEELQFGTVNESTRTQILHGVLAYLESILTKVDLAFGLLLSSLACFATLPATAFQSLDADNASILSRALEAVLHHLKSKNPNLQVLALRCLCQIPVDVWSSASGWGETAWVRIMSFLDSRDSTVRKATLAVLHHADPSLATLHISRLLQALSSLPAPSRPKEFTTRDHILSLLLEASAIVDSSPEAWALRTDSIVSTARGTREGREVFGVVVVGTIDRFSYAREEVQAGFAEALLRKGTWRNDLSLALLVAATAGGATTTEGRREEVAEELAKWLANEDGQLPSDFLEPLLEPFLLSLLRLASHAPSTSFQTVASHLQLAAHSAPSSGQPLFALFDRCYSDPSSRRALEAAGSDARSTTLPGFFTALQQHLDRPPRDSVDTEALSPSARPLRYDVYQAPVSPQGGKREGERKWKGKGRERTERGGRGGMAESLMTPGALALIGAEGEGSSDDESDSSRSHFRRATRAAAEVRVEEERGIEDEDVPSLQLRGRRGSSADGPPADLLIELGTAAAVDPFHDGT